MNKEIEEKAKTDSSPQGDSSQGGVISKVKTTLETVTDVEKKTKKQEDRKQSVAPSTIVEETGVNLIPTMTEVEIKTEEKKKRVNLGSLISLSLLFSVTILVTGFNIISRMQLDSQKRKLQEVEKRVMEYSYVTSGNTEILERIFLFKDIQEGRISTRIFIEELRSVANTSGNNVINTFAFPGGEGFEISGNASSLEDIAKFWYLMDNHEKFKDVQLRSFSGTGDKASYSFTGRLNLEEFAQE
ncbi:MAG: transmembrane(s)protein [candidate division WS6 bacterium 36_33]|uniref:Transmembrane(S)protein n=1 Tax=candidate division WS6 bacterium 36_33 TaxID=1641388 RepID=A0A101GZ99_9BACT|nr:MAG: transmembrane(s)protein [candidate division WS6 bacterium 36_33]